MSIVVVEYLPNGILGENEVAGLLKKRTGAHYVLCIKF